MITYEKYKTKFGTKDKSGQYRVSLSNDMYDLLSSEDKFSIAFENEITLVLMEDILIRIATCVKNGDKDNDLKSCKKLANVIKTVLNKYKNSDNALNSRFYKISASPDELDFFAENARADIKAHRKTAGAIGAFGRFYRALNTEVGTKIYETLLAEKTKALEGLYNDNHKNGLSSYYNILDWIIGKWQRSITLYEYYSGQLKFVNKGIKYARTRNK